MLRCAIQYLCLHLSIFPKNLFPCKYMFNFSTVVNGLIKIDVYLFQSCCFFNGIQLTTLMVLLPTSCTQEAVFHLMATNTNYQQNTLKDCVRAMLLNTILQTLQVSFSFRAPTHGEKGMPSCLILYLNVCRARRASHLLELAASLVTAGLKQKNLVWESCLR